MVKKDNFRVLDGEEVSQYKFNFCELCEFHECELVQEYEQYKESHNKCPKSQASKPNKNHAIVLNGTSTPLKENEISLKSRTVINAKSVPLNDKGDVVTGYYFSGDERTESNTNVLSYNEKELENGCIMSCRYVYQIECGRQRVTEGIGDHFKIETDYEGNIKEGTTDRWEPLQPVFISAQTGQGKNYFIENTLIPYVRELNYRKKTNYKILILSNRLALKQQIKNRLDGDDDLDNEEGKIYSYGECADVMTYQSLLRHDKQLEKRQKKAQSRYIFVICDEAHFFTSDAMFNPHTYKILWTIVRLFENAVRVYMSATPYECLEYIIKVEEDHRRCLNQNKCQDEWKGEMMVFYHFKRDYSYLDVKTYSVIGELYDEIVESVSRGEKWLIFIDDKEKCVKVKAELEKVAEDKECPLVVEGADPRKKVEKVFAVDADSKGNPTYQEIVKQERLNKDTYVLISTSVLDNGVNLTGINNIVVSDMSKVKCLQMAGRARVEDISDRKTMYVKRFGVNDVKKQIASLERQKDAYQKYQLAYSELEEPHLGYDIYYFLEKYYNGSEKDWKDAKHWFGRSIDKPGNLYLNEIAKSLMEKLIPQYQYIFDEMVEENSRENEQQGQSVVIHTGQKYLEYQLSWFGKKYCVDDDITYADKEKPKKEFIAFLKSYADSGEKIEDTGKDSPFRKKITKLSDLAFGRKDPNKERIYSITKINSILEEENIDYKIVSNTSHWVVERCDWEIEDSE